MKIRTDSAGHPYIDVKHLGRDYCRITFIQKGGYGKPSLRLQIRVAGGRLHQGPEIPLNRLEKVIGAMVRIAILYS